MAGAGDAFTWTPKVVRPLTPQFSMLTTDSDSFKQQFQLLDEETEEKFELLFGEDIASVRLAVREHYVAQKHNYTPFSWTPPTYISGSAMTVRYDGFEENPRMDGGGEIWDIRVVFRKET